LGCSLLPVPALDFVADLGAALITIVTPGGLFSPGAGFFFSPQNNFASYCSLPKVGVFLASLISVNFFLSTAASLLFPPFTFDTDHLSLTRAVLFFGAHVIRAPFAGTTCGGCRVGYSSPFLRAGGCGMTPPLASHLSVPSSDTLPPFECLLCGAAGSVRSPFLLSNFSLQLFSVITDFPFS